MKVQEFVDKYNSFSNEEIKKKFIKERIVTEYVPYTKKMQVCTTIAKVTSINNVESDNGNKEYYSCNSVLRFMLFQKHLFDLYTDIEMQDGEEGVKEFELIDQYALNDAIISAIPEREYANMQIILDMCVDDYAINENNIIRYIDTKLEALGMVTNTFLDTVSDAVKKIDKTQIDNILANISENKDN